MGFLRRLFTPERYSSKLAKLAESIAGRRTADVRNLIRRRISQMQPAEAVGYIRARAALLVQDEVDRAFPQKQNLDPALRSSLFELAMQAIVQQALDCRRETSLTIQANRRAA